MPGGLAGKVLRREDGIFPRKYRRKYVVSYSFSVILCSYVSWIYCISLCAALIFVALSLTRIQQIGT